jgi:hypothetical protein
MSPAGNAQSLKLASDVKLDSRRLYVNSGVHGERRQDYPNNRTQRPEAMIAEMGHKR